ncbi:Acetyl/propionyl-CoA carboxylase, alpha subunit [Variovorax sp. HW608]|uniref:acetyl-CoA carboxylase biotin carboxyl carrier protein subunit n=1 Tax=Variovorax sp. HW608 TaxID=1034889 RepID=UPI00081FD056|nr:acetyl-CoA carboxylase biotin carboxyl carrier protein subunit [Variovorax sp. HW608]SCK09955.1 Acetyl/propionyl-CoA carboxylase, alpha subunit [Variovorax sp. HW608]
MAHAFFLNGKEHELWLSRAGGGYRLHTDGKQFPIGLLARGDHAHELLIHEDSCRTFIARRGDEVHVHLDGESYILSYVHNLKRFASEQKDEGEAVARAPMPGSVIAVSVEAGQQVQRGAPLMVIESMKMETTINAACDGVVQSLHVSVGQTFDRDAVLVSLERSATA